MSKTDFGHETHQSTVLELIEQTAQFFPDRIAIQQTNGRCITYARLVTSARHVGGNLRKKGFQTGDRALLLSTPGVDAVTWVLGVMYAGGVSVVADPGMGKAVFEERVKAAQPQWALVDDPVILLSAVPPLMALARYRLAIPDISNLKGMKVFHRGNHPVLNLKYPSFKSLLRSTPATFERQDPDQEAIIVFTSGTTDKPKGVIHTVGSLTATLSLLHDLIKPEHGSVFYTNLPYFLLIGVGLGASVVIETGKPTPAQVLKRLRKYSVSILFGPPGELLPIIAYCQEHQLQLPALIANIYLGSAPVYRSFLKKLESILPTATGVACIYGMTEILPIATVDGRLKAVNSVKGDLLGVPVIGTKTSIATDGELIVTGPHMCRSYLGDEQTLSKIYTGDLVRLDGKQLVMIGRKKDMILRGNYNIYPALYEPTIETIPGVQACAMVGMYDEDRADEVVILAVEADGSRPLTSTLIEKNLRAGAYSIDTPALPDRIIIRQLPRAGRQHKIDKTALKQLLKQDGIK